MFLNNIQFKKWNILWKLNFLFIIPSSFLNQSFSFEETSLVNFCIFSPWTFDELLMTLNHDLEVKISTQHDATVNFPQMKLCHFFSFCKRKFEINWQFLLSHLSQANQSVCMSNFLHYFTSNDKRLMDIKFIEHFAEDEH